MRVFYNGATGVILPAAEDARLTRHSVGSFPTVAVGESHYQTASLGLIITHTGLL